MEGIVINHQRRRNQVKSPPGYESDHIIPYCISKNDSISNIQFLKIMEHRRKTRIDFKIIKIFKKNGWIEKITNYSHELKKSIDFLKNEYLKLYRKMKDENK